MTEYSWPANSYAQRAHRARNSWAQTAAALPLGTKVAGQVIGRQPFGVFIEIDGHPDALGLAEVTSFPRGASLPALGTRVEGEVIWHTEHHHQIKIRLAWAG
ncbi:hypothetical protein ACLIYP_22635 [Streptomyces nanhaiensis]